MEKLHTLLLVLLMTSVVKVHGGSLVKRDPNQPSMFQNIWSNLGQAATGLIHLVGTVIPLRGIASVAADLGIPWAEAALEVLTPRHTSTTTTTSTTAKPTRTRQSRIDRSDNIPLLPDDDDDEHHYDSHEQKRVDHGGFSSYREEMSSAVGAVLGDKECWKKLACLSARRLEENVNGGSVMALMAAPAQRLLPEGLQEPYLVFRDSILYSKNCNTYKCGKDVRTRQDEL